MKRLVALLISASVSTAVAENEILRAKRSQTRESSLGTNLSLAKDYSALDLFANVGLSEDWKLLIRSGQAKTTNSSTTPSTNLVAKDFRVGADYKINEDLLPRHMVIFKEEPGQIKGQGMTFGLDYNLHKLWNGELKTLFIFDVEGVRYWQSSTTQLSSRLPPEEVLNQSSLTIGVGQELGKNWVIMYSLIGFKYDQDPEIWSEAVSDRLWTERALDVPVSGFPRASSTLQVQWSPLYDWSFGLAASTNRGALDSISRSTSLTASKVVDDTFIVDLLLSTSATNGRQDGSLLGLGLEYVF